MALDYGCSAYSGAILNRLWPSDATAQETWRLKRVLTDWGSQSACRVNQPDTPGRK